MEQQHRNALPQGFQLQEYQIESVLGKPGGFGITYLATDTHLCQSVAIKEYLPSDFAVREGVSTVYVRSTSYEDSFQWGLKCFIEEARVLARFNHYNIVRVLRFFETNGTAYMVMEYQKGKSLTDYLIKQRILTEEELKAIVLPLLEGLTEIHNAGFLHRDIKPNNIYIRQYNSPVLLDFGSARYAVGQKTRSVTSIVTPGYAPLEQYDNEINDQGPWSDIYALGAVMYCAISGEIPPAATRRVMKDPMIPAVKVGEGRYSKNLLEAIDWALQLSEEDRPQTVVQWRDQMLASIPPVADSTKNVLELRWSIINITGIVVIFLLSATIAILWRENLILNIELQSTMEHARREVKAEFAKEQAARQRAEKQLEIEQTRRKKAENRYHEAEWLITEIQRFESQAVERPNFGFDEKKYYDVANVRLDEVLNIREFPGHLNKKVGEIPRTEKCLKYLQKFRVLKSNVWVKIQYQEIQGWVNSYYLAGNEQDCQKEKTSE